MKDVQSTKEAFIPKREHPAPQQNMKFLHFLKKILWVIFDLLDPDLATKINADTDPEHWWTSSKSSQAFSGNDSHR